STRAYGQLSGTYTICASGCDYSTFSDAVNDLNNNGVSGPVTFNADTGSYNESIYIYSISGASSTNTITFNGAGFNTHLYYSLSNYSYGGVLYLDYTNYVTFKN